MTAPKLTEAQYINLLSIVGADYSARALSQAAFALGWKARGEADIRSHVLLPPAGTQMHADFLAGVAAKIAAIRKDDAE